MYLQTADGTQLYYEVDGREDAPAIVFVGGFCVSTAWWQQQLALQRDFRLVRFDARGVGVSDKPADASAYSVAQNVEDLHALLVSLDLQDVLLVGWSMGVSVALTYCDRYQQERVARLMCVDGSPRMMQAPDWQWGVTQEQNQMLREQMAATPDDFFATFFSMMFAHPSVIETHPSLAEDLFAALRLTPPFVAQAVWGDCMTLDLRTLLPDITLPTLVVVGEQSLCIPPAASHYIASHIPHAQLEQFAQGGHALMVEEPARFNALLRQFALATTPAGV